MACIAMYTCFLEARSFTPKFMTIYFLMHHIDDIRHLKYCYSEITLELSGKWFVYGYF